MPLSPLTCLYFHTATPASHLHPLAQPSQSTKKKPNLEYQLHGRQTAVLQARKKTHFISAFSTQKQPGSGPFYLLKLNQGVPCFILTSSLRKLFFHFFSLPPKICYLCCFTNGHHNSPSSLLQRILCIVSASLRVSGQGGRV